MISYFNVLPLYTVRVLKQHIDTAALTFDLVSLTVSCYE